jgi:hypothetical protein
MCILIISMAYTSNITVREIKDNSVLQLRNFWKKNPISVDVFVCLFVGSSEHQCRRLAVTCCIVSHDSVMH